MQVTGYNNESHKPALACVEFNSVARGIKTTDEMLKKASITLLESAPICPGKYIIVIGGKVGPVEESYLKGLEIGNDSVVDQLFLPYAHEQLIPAISAVNIIKEVDAIGVVETFSVASAILAADASCKRSLVSLIEIRLARGLAGKAYYTLTGSQYDVEEALNAAELVLGKYSGLLLRTEIIPNPHPDLIKKVL